MRSYTPEPETEARVPAGKMHVDEVDTNATLVRRLLAVQFPQWAGLPILPVEFAGTDNALYRLGDDMAVRLPRIHWAVGDIEKDLQWLPRLAPHLPLAIPVPLVLGMPAEGYPWHWEVYRWLAGENATLDRIADPRQTATTLAQFIAALQAIDTTGGPLAAGHGLRGAPLATRDDETPQLSRLSTAWLTPRQRPRSGRPPCVRRNGTARQSGSTATCCRATCCLNTASLSAVIDFAGLGVGDPACDLMIAWGLFTGESRDLFRRATLGVDDATGTRPGHGVVAGAIFIPYYLDSNPVGVANARRAIDELLADFHAIR